MHDESARSVATTEHAVIIAGGGPTGLMLAAELALSGVDVAIVERRQNQDVAGSRAGGLHARTIEVLDQRGVAERFLSHGQVMQVATFGSTPLDISDFPTRHHYGLALVQQHIERILAAWVAELAVPIYRGLEVTGFSQDDTGVDVALSDGRPLRAKYLVGCDGGRSVIRKTAGIDFPGWDPSVSYLIAELETTSEPAWGIRRSDKGINGIGKLEDAKRVRVVLCEQNVMQGEEPSLDELREALIAVHGTDYGVHNVTWLSRFTDMARQAESYRDRRVLLAGDAAHVHSPVGGQGLNIGVQDAVNLGWKLAQVVHATAPESLLDTYHAERHPIAARVLQSTLAQTALNRGDERSNALRDTMSNLLKMDEPRRRYAAMMSGLDIHYDLGAGHPLLGRRMPDLDLVTDRGTRRVFAFLHHVRAVLLNLREPVDITPWADRVQRIDARYTGVWELPVLGVVEAPAAVLIRPDGYVAWVGDGTDEGLRDALIKWFGPPRDTNHDGVGDLCDLCGTGPKAQGGCVVAISDVKQGTVPLGPHLTIQNAVITAVGSNRFWIAEGGVASAFTGLFVSVPSAAILPAISVGDVVDIYDLTTVDFRGEIEVDSFADVAVVGSLSSVVPVLPPIGQLTDPSTAGRYDGSLVRVSAVTVGASSASDRLFSVGQIGITDDLHGLPNPLPTTGQRISSITGVFRFQTLSDGATTTSSIIPRSTADIVF